MTKYLKSAYFSKTIFERLVDSNQERKIYSSAKVEDVIRSVKYNLTNILNSRIGHAQSAPELGLVDFNDATVTELDVATQIKKTIVSCVLKYEPRIKNVTIDISNYKDSPVIFVIKLLGELDIDGVDEQIVIDILHDNDKQYKIY